ncbi:Hint domain-containing protein [Rhodoblastus acidophilus]|uniref:Hint domain-containing protein n=1 Tax=Candidatus Rhodoblastus alkanivorans TaxID=2954117 RepID=A0ABS9Z8I3_9HYPH|nr:Hint domain-containing protein [Candidatus Rhodoblastus alkanivorans]MCI4678011.1 Hint domain-containing protein [Candidatus Rhodoblastus alkanivorans]MCI4683906.1 Hint domain-containing protein [Candidatus Rhodoblastus alkanivorans]MDI4641223.1 Hint domain-containing protein [Rhodoblastus acidophilus]
MTDYTWNNTVTNGDWEDANNWTSLPSGGTYPQLSTDNATIAVSPGGAGITVNVNSGETISIQNLVLTGSPGYGAATLQMNGGSLTTSSTITLTNGNSYIDGYGTIVADGGFTKNVGTPGITASGGVLDLTGNISPGTINLFIDSASLSTLKLESTVSQSSITINSANQTLEIGASGALTLSAAESVTNGAIRIDGGTLTDMSGLTIGAGASLTGTGTVNGPITGAGTITASGGALTLSGQVDTSGTSSSLVIEDGATLQLTSTTDVGLPGVNPTLTFTGNGGLFIDTAASVGGLHLGLIFGFSGADRIQIKEIGLNDTVSWDSSLNKLTIHNGPVSESFTFEAGTQGQFFTISQSNGVDTLQLCFMAGTSIRTPDGDVAIETLKRGDLVMTVDGAAKPVNWLGRQTVSTIFADPVRSLPIRVRAGALAENAPSRDLLISPDHALLVEDVLIQAGALVNGTSIIRETKLPKVFVYCHVELDDHSLILAENTPAETFVDNVDRMNFDNWAEFEALYPEGKAVEELPYPRAKARRQVPAYIRVALADRAQAIGATESAVA